MKKLGVIDSSKYRTWDKKSLCIARCQKPRLESYTVRIFEKMIKRITEMLSILNSMKQNCGILGLWNQNS